MMIESGHLISTGLSAPEFEVNGSMGSSPWGVRGMFFLICIALLVAAVIPGVRGIITGHFHTGSLTATVDFTGAKARSQGLFYLLVGLLGIGLIIYYAWWMEQD